MNILQYIFFDFKVTVVLSDPAYCPNNCGRRYTGVNRKKSLLSHLRYVCGGQRMFLCAHCARRFSKKSTLKKHSLIVHKIILEN